MGSGTLGNFGRAIFGGIENRKTQRAVQSLLEEASVSMGNPNYSYRDFLLSAVRRRVSQDPRVKEYGELIKQRDKQTIGKQKTAQLGQATRDISQGLGAPQDVPETGQAPAPGPVSPPELSGLGGGPAQQQPRSGSPIPQQPGVLSGQGFQEFGEPPQTQEQALGRLAEYQEAGAAPEAIVDEVLKQPALAQFPKSKDVAIERRFQEKMELEKQKEERRFAEWNSNAANIREKDQRKAVLGHLKYVKKVLSDAKNERTDKQKLYSKALVDLNKARADASSYKDPREAEAVGAELAALEKNTETLKGQFEEADATYNAVMQAGDVFSTVRGVTASQADLEKFIAESINAQLGKGSFGGGLGQPNPAPKADPNALKNKYGLDY